MNRMVKGSIAGATGIALLMGGYGSYALWTDTGTAEGAAVTTGELDIEAGAVAWDNTKTAQADDWSAAKLIVPGDEITVTQTFTVTATGERMEGTLTFVPGAIDVPAGFTQDITEYLAVSTEVAGPTVTGLTKAGNTYTFTAPIGSQTFTTTATFTFDETTPAQVGQGLSASIADSSWNLAQSSPNS